MKGEDKAINATNLMSERALLYIAFPVIFDQIENFSLKQTQLALMLICKYVTFVIPYLTSDL